MAIVDGVQRNWMTRRGAAEIEGISRQWIDQLVRRGGLQVDEYGHISLDELRDLRETGLDPARGKHKGTVGGHR